MLFTALSPTPQLSSPPYAQYSPARSSPLAPAPTWPMSPSPKREAQEQSLNFSPTPTPTQGAIASRQQHNQSSQTPAQTQTSTVSSSRIKTTPTYAQRYANTISNPLATHHAHATRAHPASSSPSSRHKRRTLFLNRIKQERDSGRFENRADRFMLLEHVAERREWGQEMRRKAEGIVKGFGEEVLGDMDMEVDSGQDGIDEADARALDEYLSQEEAMEMALLENNEDQMQNNPGNHPRESGSFSDDEYDHLFIGLANQGREQDGMDMS